MSLAPLTANPLLYFIHHDPDALRMEMSGCLTGRAAQEAYEDWRSETWVPPGLPFVVDISYVTSADETGRAVLTAWRSHGARIVASSSASRAIAHSIPGAPATGH